MIGVGCASPGPVDLTGMYRVDSDVGSMPCGADQPIVPAPAYLKFAKMSFLGADFFQYDKCPDASGTNCTSGGGLFGGGFSEPIDNGWRDQTTISSFGGSCTLSYENGTAILTGTKLVIERSTYSDAPALTQAQCTTDEARKRGMTMPCSNHAHIEATKQ